MMEISKSTRHAKITGDFGETLVLYWLSKYGFECAPVDHTGIDIIARNPHTREVMGISVKSRSRNEGAEGEHISIPNDNFAKAEAACAAFGCVPYFAIVVDAGNTLRGFILPMAHLLQMFPKGKTASGWKMTEPYLKKYAADPQILTFEFQTETTKWWGRQSAATDIKKAKRLFREAGLPFPKIPRELAAQLKERKEWIFSTRDIKMSPHIMAPYNLHHYIAEADETHVEDYVVLAHQGHGANSYFLQYYVVRGALRMFLYLSWGDAYGDAVVELVEIRKCFSLADKIVSMVQTLGGLWAGERLMIVAADAYRSYWSPPGEDRRGKASHDKRPAEVLAEVLHWLSKD